LGNLISILATENGPFDINVRVAAGLAAKNCLVARDLHRRQQLVESFQRIDHGTKNELKRGVIILFLIVLFLIVLFLPPLF
jgi:hypothetical protein